METRYGSRNESVWLRLAFFWLAIAMGMTLMANAQAFTLNVEGCDAQGVCTPYAGTFRYLVEEDNSTLNLPQAVQVVPPYGPSSTLAIHKSHAAVVTSGSGATSGVAINVPDARYFVTVMPDAGYALGGAANYSIQPAVAGGPGAVAYNPTVTVKVARHPLPTAQISIFAHVDHNPINNTWDQHDGGVGADAILNGGLGGASVTISDNLGKVSVDVFGNPLGTRYNADGTVAQIGTGVITTMTARDVNDPVKNPYGLKIGEAIIKNLSPGKYGVTVVPPQFDDNSNPVSWIQTATIEGTKTIDAWVKANEPKIFIEGFGQGFNHVAFGFVKVSPAGASPIAGQSVKVLPWNLPSTDPDYVDRTAYTGSIQGTLRLNHFSRPPNLQGYFPGPAVDKCWVGLNATVVTPGVTPAGLYAAPCGANGIFTISNVPPGTYQLVYWDEPLDYLFGFRTVTVPAGAGAGEAVNLGDVLAFRWFGALEGKVFFDTNQNGFRDAGETGLPNQAVNLRFRDGSIYQATATDLTGSYQFEEVFPFFNWLVTEVDFARFKATGMTTAIDYGGLIADVNAPVWPSNGNKTLQPQVDVNPNTGNNLTRTETGPVLLEAMQLFLGQTNLIDWGKTNYPAGENGGISGIAFYSVTRAENDPRYGVGDPWEPGIPRVQVCLYKDNLNNTTGLPVPNGDGVIDDANGNGRVDLCDVDNYPFGNFPGPEDVVRSGDGVTFSLGDAIQVAATDSWDDHNPTGCVQDRPVLHGGEIGGGQIPECADAFGTWNQVRPGVFDGGYAFGAVAGVPVGDPNYLAAGMYIVEAVPPPSYSIVKEEDKNVIFGEAWTPGTLLLPPVCVGTVSNNQPAHVVPAEYALFPGEPISSPPPGTPTPLCNMKQVSVKAGQNTAADFHLFTEVPKAARVVGFVLNDLTAEFNAGSPVFGEKLAAKWIPVSFKDWAGREITRTYADEWGTYNALLPSSYSANVPTPSGVSPAMITLVLNDPVLPDGTPDPYYDPTYAVSPWTLNYHSGKTTYVDTPIVPIRAFAAAGTGFSTAPVSGTPTIRSVDGPGVEAGALICTNANALPQSIMLTSLGPTVVLDPVTGTNVTRDYGFGATAGTVTLNRPGLPPLTLPAGTWTDSTITATVPAGTTSGTLMVTRGGTGGLTSEVGLQLTVRDCTGINVRTVSAGGSIQAAIDAASPGDLIMVAPGTYNENVVMYKPVHLQGSGTGSTFINANPNPLDRLQAFHAKLDSLGARDFAAFLLDDPFVKGEAPGVFVMGEFAYQTGTLNPGNPFATPGQASIDGFTISGSKAGGGIFLALGASNVVISNNNITNNQGNLAGGISIGGIRGFDSQNDNVVVRNNKVHANGGVDGSGGIAMYDGAENYLVEGNLVTGNMSRFNGGGIAHNGFSAGNNVIRKNRILFNEVFFGALLNLAGDGGGIFVGDDIAGVDGTGNVRIDGNLIQGNLTGAGSGAGIRAFAVNAADVAASPANDATWSKLEIVNNIIVNNVAAVNGGGISLQDVLRATIVNNTIANNDSTATGALAFAAGSANSTPQPAGIVSAPHSAALLALITRPGEPTYSNPVMLNNIIWHNRSFYNDATANGGAGGLVPNPAGQYWDLGVVNTAGVPPTLTSASSILSTTANPGFVSGGGLGYVNTLATATVIDEGGNNINVGFTPLDPAAGDYHVVAGSPAVDAGSNAASVPAFDFDGDYRPRSAANVADIGADEQPGAVPPPPTPVFAVLDNFNRANATTLNFGTSWQQIIQGGAAGIRVNGNQAFCINNALCSGTVNVGGAYAIWNATGEFGAHQGAAFTFASPTAANRNGASLVLKANNPDANGIYQNAIRVRYATGNGGQVLVQSAVNGGVFQTHGTLVGSFADGDTMMATVNAAGLVTVWKTTAADVTTQLGTVQLPTTGNRAWTTGGGRIGMRLLPNRRVDDFRGGNVQ
jgi:hypothetical protein